MPLHTVGRTAIVLRVRQIVCFSTAYNKKKLAACASFSKCTKQKFLPEGFTTWRGGFSVLFRRK